MKLSGRSFNKNAGHRKYFALSLVVVVLLFVRVSNIQPVHADTTSPITINAVANGNTVSGMYIALEQYGSLVWSGYTPVTFYLNTGEVYQILATSYGQYTFSSWSTGDTSNPTSVTASGTMYLNAMYSSGGGGGGPSSVTVDAEANGNSLSGMYIALEQSGSIVNAGFAPVTFSLNAGEVYQVMAENYGQYSFQQWTSGSSADPASITASGSMSLDAEYSGTGGGGGGGPASVTVGAQSNGNNIPGMYIELEQSGSIVATGYTPVTFSLNQGSVYQIEAQSYGQYSFSSWSSGDTSDPTTITASGSMTDNALYGSNGCGGCGGGGGTGLGMVVPLYVYPNYVWQDLINYHEQYPSVPMMAVINPAGGPGSYDSNIASWVANLQNAGIKVLGYISSGYTSVPISTFDAEVNEYVSWYGVHGIFVDDMENVYGYEWYYQDVASYAYGNGINFILGNPGTGVTSSYVGIFSDIGFYENSGLPSISLLQSYNMGYPASGFSFIAYNSGLPSQSYFDSAAQYVSWVYVTDAPNAWTSLPSYMSSELAELSAA